MKYTKSFVKNLNLIIYFLIIILTTFFTYSQANAGNIICGVHYEGDGEVPVVRTIKIAAYVSTEKGGKKNCEEIVNTFNTAKEGNNKFHEIINNIATEIGIVPDYNYEINEMRMVWMAPCIQELRSVNKSKICGEMDPYSFYLIIEFKDLVISKKLFNKKLDNSGSINQLNLFLNNT